MPQQTKVQIDYARTLLDKRKPPSIQPDKITKKERARFLHDKLSPSISISSILSEQFLWVFTGSNQRMNFVDNRLPVSSISYPEPFRRSIENRYRGLTSLNQIIYQ